MNHYTPALAAALVSLVAIGSAAAEDRTYTDLGPFTAVNASAGVTVEITQSDKMNVYAEAHDNRALDHLQITTEADTLSITRDLNLLNFILEGGLVGAIFGDNDAVTVYVSLPELIGVEASSGANISVAPFTVETLTAASSSGADLTFDNITADHLDLSASSGADLTIAGSCNSVDGASSSGADLNGRELTCESGDLDASSGSDLKLSLHGSITAGVSSGADITIWGRPQVANLDQSSGGNIRFND